MSDSVVGFQLSCIAVASCCAAIQLESLPMLFGLAALLLWIQSVVASVSNSRKG